MKITIEANKSALQYSLAMAPKIEQICEPLFKHLGFTFFTYTRLYSNGKYLHLSTNTSWSKIFYENAFYNEVDVFHRIRSNTPLTDINSLSLSGPPQGKRCKALFHHDIWNMCSFYKRHSEYIEGWNFGTTKENLKILDLYMNQRYILQHFIFYFRDKSSRLLDLHNFDESRLINTNLDLSPISMEDYSITNRFIKLIDLEKFNVKYKNREICFSKRELMFLEKLSQGESIKQIAYDQKLSPRTIESHLNTIKLKAGINNRSSLIELYTGYFGNI